MSPLESLLERTVAGLGYGLADFEYINNGRMLRVFIEKTHELVPERAGVTLADCESVSRQLQRVLEVEGIEYDRLEVSSPGLDRRLKKAADFARFAGCEARVRLRHPVNGHNLYTISARAGTQRLVIEQNSFRPACGGEMIEDTGHGIGRRPDLRFFARSFIKFLQSNCAHIQLLET